MKDVSVNINEVVKKFMDVYNRGLAENDLTNANRAMEFIGKHLGMLIERQDKQVVVEYLHGPLVFKTLMNKYVKHVL